MLAKDIMTTNVVTIPPETTVADIAQVLIDNKKSGVPVVDENGRPVGMVSEGDLLQQAGLRGERQRSWWLRLVSSPEQDAKDFVKQHGGTAADFMTSEIVSVAESAPTTTI
ncbi:MAG: CBS domain-containing protein, partial [Alphaproteobacteria bacterium]